MPPYIGDYDAVVGEFTGVLSNIRQAHDGRPTVPRQEMEGAVRRIGSSLTKGLLSLVSDVFDDDEPPPSARSLSTDSTLDDLQTPPKEMRHAACDIEDEAGQPAMAQKAKSQVVERALAAMEKISSELKKFYRWLKEKAKQVAAAVWQKIRNAFSTMLTWIKSACSEMKGTAKVHAM